MYSGKIAVPPGGGGIRNLKLNLSELTQATTCLSYLSLPFMAYFDEGFFESQDINYISANRKMSQFQLLDILQVKT
jgi:hypothetical protein